jgi:hypothetical protein
MVIALDDLVLGPPESLSYARGVSAHAISRALDVDEYLVAEEAPGDLAEGEEGNRLLLFRPAGAPLSSAPLIASITPAGDAKLLWGGDGDVAFTGRRISDGLRRGRYAERLYLTDKDGRRLTVLIGYEPVEYAVRRRQLLAWPKG